MTVMMPGDPRSLRDTGRTWQDGEFSGPIMVDGFGNEFKVVKGSVADISNGRLDAILDWFESSRAAAAAPTAPPPGGWRIPASDTDALNDLPDWAKED